MPQQSFDDQLNPVRLEVHVVLNEILGGTTVQLVSRNKGGKALALATIALTTTASAELLPEALRMVAFGWLCAGPREMVTDVAKWLREEKRRLDRLEVRY